MLNRGLLRLKRSIELESMCMAWEEMRKRGILLKHALFSTLTILAVGKRYLTAYIKGRLD
jgi:hypothetical protein